jgi:hypothetical protein
MQSEETGSLALRAEKWVEVRCIEEILATLDASSRFDVPEMFEYCVSQLKVTVARTRATTL